MNKIIFTLSITLSAGFGFLAGKHHSSPEIVVNTLVSDKQMVSSASSVAQKALVEIKHDFHADTAVAPASLPHPLLPQQVSSPESSSQQEIDAIKAEYEFKQRSEDFTAWLTKNQQSKPWFDLGVEMHGRFEAEEKDYRWASVEEGKLQSLFTQEQELAGIALKSTSCKSTQCQITISVLNQEHANETAMALTKVLGSKRFSQIIIDSQIQQGEAIFYVSRNEKGFEFN